VSAYALTANIPPSKTTVMKIRLIIFVLSRELWSSLDDSILEASCEGSTFLFSSLFF